VLPPRTGARGSLASPAVEAFEREQVYWDREADKARTTRWAPLQVMLTGGQDEFGLSRGENIVVEGAFLLRGEVTRQ
jgi:hypothetical protein